MGKKMVVVDVEFNRVLFGRIVRQRRSRAGLTQVELGQMVGWRGTAVSRVERGNTDMLTVRSYLKLCNLLDIDPGRREFWQLVDEGRVDPSSTQ